MRIVEGKSAPLAIAPVREFWRARLGLGAWPGEDIYRALCTRFVRRVHLANERALREACARGVLYLANHQVGVESTAFAIVASALGGGGPHAGQGREPRSLARARDEAHLRLSGRHRSGDGRALRSRGQRVLARDHRAPGRRDADFAPKRDGARRGDARARVPRQGQQDERHVHRHGARGGPPHRAGGDSAPACPPSRSLRASNFRTAWRSRTITSARRSCPPISRASRTRRAPSTSSPRSTRSALRTTRSSPCPPDLTRSTARRARGWTRRWCRAWPSDALLHPRSAGGSPATRSSRRRSAARAAASSASPTRRRRWLRELARLLT